MNNEQVAHHFIYDSSEAKGSNFSCINGRLYSYSSIMATIDREKKDYSYRPKKYRTIQIHQGNIEVIY